MVKFFYFLIIIIIFILTEFEEATSQDCSSSSDNIDYLGGLSFTESNTKCQNWPDSYSPYLADNILDANNFCRNPQGAYKKERAYCFTDLIKESWEYCSIPKCIGCSKVHGINHGVIKLSNDAYYEDESFQPGSTITFSCNDRSIYDTSSGSLKWVCSSESKWSESKLPRCLWRGYIQPGLQLANCWSFSTLSFYKSDQPRRIFYGTVTDESCVNWETSSEFNDLDFPEESKKDALNYCRSPGDFEPSCLKSDQKLQTCKVSKCNGCPSIPYVKYSRFSLNYNLNNAENTAAENSILTYSCNSGILNGDKDLICKSGSWTGSMPSCTLLYCSDNPVQPSNTFISYRKLFYASVEDYGKENLKFDKSVVVYLCTSDFSFDDPSVSQLNYECKSGEWVLKGKFSNCIRAGSTSIQPDGIYCPIPGDVLNGYKSKSSIRKAGPNKYYGEFEITCNSGFKLNGNAVVKCTNGEWSPYPKCNSLDSCSLNILSEPAVNVNIISSNLIYNNDNTGLIAGSNVIYECLPNTVPELSKDDLKVVCLENGVWSTKIPVKCV